MFETSIVVHQPKLFDLAASLGEDGWLKAIRMADYAPRAPKGSDLLQPNLVINPATHRRIWDGGKSAS
jgi:hypothetical protein